MDEKQRTFKDRNLGQIFDYLRITASGKPTKPRTLVTKLFSGPEEDATSRLKEVKKLLEELARSGTVFVTRKRGFYVKKKDSGAYVVIEVPIEKYPQ
jgi:pyruvate-formate lyase-activating enzyme